MAELYVVILQTASRGPLARLVHSKDAPPMALELADLAGEAVPCHTVKRFPTHVTVGGTAMAAGKPAVLTLQMLKRLNDILSKRERERERERKRERVNTAAVLHISPPQYFTNILSLSTSLKSLFIVERSTQ